MNKSNKNIHSKNRVVVTREEGMGVGTQMWKRGSILQGGMEKKIFSGEHAIAWTSLVSQLVKNPPATRETWVQSLGWEDPLEKGKATHSSILAWRIPWTV